MSRTLVKSWPHREPLPEGREALERAIRLCERRGGRAFEARWPSNVCDHAYPGMGFEVLDVEDFAGWLPERYRYMTVAELRDELARLPGGAP